ncbi:MAG: nuclear transport factor 2 family protein [Caldilineaceae bacterium]|nr:nuclear transport factor 2 family protein [Caldilineaceae bacterium]
MENGQENEVASEGSRLEILKRLLEAFNHHDLNAVISFFAEECTLEMPRGPHPWGQRYTGKAQVREALASRFAGIPDVHYGQDRHWVSGNHGVSEWNLTGTTTAGVRVDVWGCDHYEFQGDKITHKNSFWKIVE